MKILIPQSLQRNVLAAVRALGRAGHSVSLAFSTAVTKKRNGVSRYVQAAYPVRPALLDPNGFVDDLIALVRSNHLDVLLPFTHDSVLPISYRLPEFDGLISVPFPDYSILSQAHDKLQTMRLAHRLGIGIPITFCPVDREELIRRKDEIPFPALVKARQGCGIGKTIRYATSFEELLAGYDEISAQVSNPPINDFSRPMIQEYVPGPIYDAMYLYNRGEWRAGVTQERTITYPANGGVGAVNTTTHNPELLGLGKQLLDAIGWHGPSQVEFKLDARDGRYKLLEINPKFWGTLACSMAAGVNFPEMAAQIAACGDVAPQFDYREGVVYYWRFPEATYAFVQQPSWKQFWQMTGLGQKNTFYDWDWSDWQPDFIRAVSTLSTIMFTPKKIIPHQDQLNDLAMRQPPAVQPEGVF